jgi:GTP:adenosylcobinamide-phosphate guanylyltransferase
VLASEEAGMKLDHVLLPCKMNSQRIPRKNLATIGGRTLLDHAIDRFQAWYNNATIWIATEDYEVRQLAARRNCQAYAITIDDLTDKRTADGMFSAWLAERLPTERCLLAQVTSPFTFRSELDKAVSDTRRFCCAAWMGRLHIVDASDEWLPLSQSIPETSFVTGNFYATWGRYVVQPNDARNNNIPVSWLSAIDINEPEDLVLADFIAARMPLSAFDDTGATP